MSAGHNGGGKWFSRGSALDFRFNVNSVETCVESLCLLHEEELLLLLKGT